VRYPGTIREEKEAEVEQWLIEVPELGELSSHALGDHRSLSMVVYLTGVRKLSESCKRHSFFK
jgi:hypothetical protein